MLETWKDLKTSQTHKNIKENKEFESWQNCQKQESSHRCARYYSCPCKLISPWANARVTVQTGRKTRCSDELVHGQDHRRVGLLMEFYGTLASITNNFPSVMFCFLLSDDCWKGNGKSLHPSSMNAVNEAGHGRSESILFKQVLLCGGLSRKTVKLMNKQFIWAVNAWNRTKSIFYFDAEMPRFRQ